ncbi:MAG: hypothetical protein V4604_06235 [Bacteroidota bacterium]
MKLLLPLFTISIVLVTSCHKDKEIKPGVGLNQGEEEEEEEEEECDTTLVYENIPKSVKPSVYLMTYPGSWWLYDDDSMDSCSSWNKYNLQAISYPTQCPMVKRTTATIPKTNYGYIYGNKRVYQFYSSNLMVNTYFSNHLVEPILDTTITSGVFYTKAYGMFNGFGAQHGVSVYKNYEVVERLKNMEVNGKNYKDVIHTKEYLTMHDGWSGQSMERTTHYYYACNVGIIRQTEYGPNSLHYDRLLVDHYIAPH